MIVQVYDTPTGEGIDEAADNASQQGCPLFMFNGRIFDVDEHADYFEVGKIDWGNHASPQMRAKASSPRTALAEVRSMAEALGWDANGSPTDAD